MEKRILNYRKYIDELLQKTGADWAAVSREHLIQISFFQHSFSVAEKICFFYFLLLFYGRSACRAS